MLCVNGVYLCVIVCVVVGVCVVIGACVFGMVCVVVEIVCECVGSDRIGLSDSSCVLQPEWFHLYLIYGLGVLI